MFISCSLTGMVFIKTAFKIVKISNIDVMLMIVKWAIKYVILSLCGDFKEVIPGRRRCFCTHVGLSCHVGSRTFTNREFSNFIIIDTMSILLT